MDNFLEIPMGSLLPGKPGDKNESADSNKGAVLAKVNEMVRLWVDAWAWRWGGGGRRAHVGEGTDRGEARDSLTMAT